MTETDWIALALGTSWALWAIVGAVLWRRDRRYEEEFSFLDAEDDDD